LSRTRVLVYGGVGDGACDYYRIGMYIDHLAALGVDVVPWTPSLAYPTAYHDDWRRALADGRAEVVLSDLAPGDVLLMSRWRNTKSACTECGANLEPGDYERHQQENGHVSLSADPIFRLLLTCLLANAEVRSRCAIVYDLDDDLFHQPDWVGHSRGLAQELDVVELLVRLADLVTVSTPVLASVLEPLTSRCLVVRNAIDLSLYPPTQQKEADPDGRPPRFLFYGSNVRRADFRLCSDALARVVSAHPGARRIWVGAPSDAVGDLVEEAYPYIQVGAEFARAISFLRPDVGLAPLSGSQFSRAKSELHWLEYSAAGAVTLATRFDGPGPYDVIRDGVDGVLAADADWHKQLERLAAEPALRADLAGRAAERVRTEYSASERARDWAAAFQWASEHAGVGLMEAREE
jgi:glycosyltransferase involved in cell wall biosynthesis